MSAAASAALEGIRLYACVEHRTNLGDFNHEVVTIGISQLPAGATNEDIALATETAEVAVAYIRTRLEEAIATKIEPLRKVVAASQAPQAPEGDHSAFDAPLTIHTSQDSERDGSSGIAVAMASPPDAVVPLAGSEAPAPPAATESLALPAVEPETFPPAERPIAAAAPVAEIQAAVQVAATAKTESAGDVASAGPVEIPADVTVEPITTQLRRGPQPKNSGPSCFDGYPAPEPGQPMVAGRHFDPFADDAPKYNEAGEAIDAKGEIICGPGEPLPVDAPAVIPAPETPPVDIPDDLDVVTTCSAFGLTLSIPPAEWNAEPITELNEDGSAGGQLKACNAALSSLHYCKELRHRASRELLDQFRESIGAEPREKITSMRDLSKAEAHLILSWIDHAQIENLEALKLACYREHPMLLTLLTESVEKIKAEKAAAASDPDDEQSEEPAKEAKPDSSEPPPNSPALTIVDGDSVDGDSEHLTPVSGVVTYSDDQIQAIDKIMGVIRAKKGGCVFLTGQAGTGKSTVTREIRKRARLVVLAPTGLAAINVGGQTIHSFFGFRPGPITRGKVNAIGNDNKLRLLERIDAILIDEISMSRTDIIDGINACLQKTFRSKLPFAGIPVIFVGDMWQLEPVVKDNEREWIEKKYKSHFWFDANVFAHTTQPALGEESPTQIDITVCELTEVHRQIGQPEFLEALNLVRTGDPRGLAYLNQRKADKGAANIASEEHEPIALTFTNRKAAAINGARMEQLTTAPVQYSAIITGEFDEEPVERELILKVGARVMMARNIMGDEGPIVNGSAGEVIGFEPDRPIYEPYDEEDPNAELKEIGTAPGWPIVQFDDGREQAITPVIWEKKAFIFDMEADDVAEEIKGGFTQVPLKLAWAITVHKSQGQTLDSVVLELETASRTHGQVYVALSRCKSFSRLYLRRQLADADLVVHQRVREFTGVEESLMEHAKEAFG